MRISHQKKMTMIDKKYDYVQKFKDRVLTLTRVLKHVTIFLSFPLSLSDSRKRWQQRDFLREESAKSVDLIFIS